MLLNRVGNPYMFTSRRFDTETSLYYYRARYYNPEIGRFLQVDPVGYVESLNHYVYCLNNPVNLVDPTGGCSSGEVPDEVAEKIIEEILERWPNATLDQLRDACRKYESGCGDMVDCQMCADYKCIKAAPVTIAAFHNCIKLEYAKCF